MLQPRQFETPVSDPTPPQQKRKLDEKAPDADGLQLDAETEKSLAETALREGIDIPEAKRRAQNRAAQRAFRERKEKHLKDLETRLAELESESRSWKTTNIALRNKLSLLENELQRYRWTEGGSSAPMPELPSHLQNSSYPQQQQNSPRPAQHEQEQHSPRIPYQHTPYELHQQQQQAQQQAQQRARAQVQAQNRHSPVTSSPGSVPGITSDTSSGGESTTLSSRTSNAEDFCAKLSSACVVDSKKIAEDAPYISADYPGWQNDALYGTNNSIEYWLQHGGKQPQSGSSGEQASKSQPTLEDQRKSQTSIQNQTQNQTQGTPNQYGTKKDSFAELFGTDNQNNFNDPLNLDFGTMANGFGGFTLEGSKDGAPDFDGLMNNDFGVFDPLDGLLEWNPPKQELQDDAGLNAPAPDAPGVSNNALPNNQMASEYSNDYSNNISNDFTGNLPNDLTNIPDGLSDNQNGMEAYAGQGTTIPAANFLGINSPMFPEGQSPLGGAYDGGDNANGGAQDEHVPIASQRFIQCADAWDRICSHPRFGEIDINSMCQELRNKARCSKSGVVLDEEDVNAVLKSMK